MARPTIQRAVANANITADMWNDNFDGIMDYADDAVDEMKEYVDDFMPSQTGNSGKYLKTNGSAASWTDLMTEFANLPTSQYINGLKITKNSSSPDDTIDVATGSCFDSTNAKILVLSATTSKQKTDLGASTTYYVYLVAKADLSAYDIVIDSSSSTPTLPTNYTLYRQIGSLTTDSDADILTVSSYSNSAGRVGYPDYANGITAAGLTSSTLSYTAPANGYIYTSYWYGNSSSTTISVNGTAIFTTSWSSDMAGSGMYDFFPVAKGDVITVSSAAGTAKFYPLKGV